MPELKQLTRVFPVEVVAELGEGDELRIVFNRNTITPAWMKDSSILDEQNDPLSLSKMLAGVIISWDLTDEGVEFPATAENISQLSYPIQQAMLSKILTAAVPTESEGKASSEDSSTQPSTSTPSSQTSPNGTQTSPSPAPSVSPSPM